MNREKIRPLVCGAMQGDATDFAALCEEIAGDVLYICIHITGHRQMGEDAAQEVLLHLKQDIVHLRDAEAFTTWLNRCISRTCNRMRARESKRAPLPLDHLAEVTMDEHIEFLPAELAEREDTRRLVKEQLAALPPKQQHILFMFYFQEMSLKEVADVLQVSQPAAGMSLTRARRALRRGIEKAGGQPLPRQSTSAHAAVPVLSLILQRDFEEVAIEEGKRRLLAWLGTAGAKSPGVLAPFLVRSAIAVGIALTVGGGIYLAAPTAPGVHEAPGAPAISYTAPALAQNSALPPAQDSPGDAPQAAPSTSRAASTSQPPPTPGEAGPAAEAAQHSISGEIALQINGAAVANSGRFAAGYTAQVYSGSTLLASATVDAFGRYTLSFTPVDGVPGYTLQLRPSLSYQCGFADGSSVYTTTFTVQQSRLPTAYIVDDKPPTGHIGFYNAAGQEMDGTGVNPTRAHITVQDATDTQLQWQLRAADGSLLHEGAGGEIPLDILPSSEQGIQYSLHVTVTDLGGNTCVLQRDFWLVRGL